MGLNCSNLCKKRAKIIMLGLDSAGKTSIFYRLVQDELVTTVPTLGFNCEEILYRDVKFEVWDIGGQGEIRQLWRHYLANTAGIIFVVDSADRARIGEAAEALRSVLFNDEIGSVALLVLANKQDLPDSMGPGELAENLGLSSESIVKGRQWHVRPADTLEGTGLHDGLDWLVDTLNKYHFKRSCF